MERALSSMSGESSVLNSTTGAYSASGIELYLPPSLPVCIMRKIE